MTTATIFGTGAMASAIAGVLGKGGADVAHISHDQVGSAQVTGDIVVLAVPPYPAVDEIIAQHGEQLAGKVVVDITNPLDFQTFDALVVPSDSSAAAEIQKKLPASKVLKAFNTNFAGTLSAGTIGSSTTTVLVAGDDAEAKSTLLSAVEKAGLGAIDAGSLKRARELESLGFLQLTLAAGEKISWTGGFSVTA